MDKFNKAQDLKFDLYCLDYYQEVLEIVKTQLEKNTTLEKDLSLLD